MKTTARPNDNLNLLHLCFLTGSMLAIFGWGLICLEADLAAAQAPTILAGK